MGQQTVKANLKLIEELTDRVNVLEAQNSELSKVVKNQKGIAGALLKLTVVMLEAGTVRSMLTYRSKWIKIQKQLREVANVQDKEERENGKDQSSG